MKNFLFAFCLFALVSLSVGCRKPFHEAVRVPIETSEIAILAETVNENNDAVVAPPEKGEGKAASGNVLRNYYAKRVINARMVEIPYYWKQTGYVCIKECARNGKWEPAARLIVVDTQPETREWSESSNQGTSRTDQGIWVESEDSVGFSTGISITARIESQDNAITFLANYPPKSERQTITTNGKVFNVEVASLEDIMDTEVRTKIQEVFAYEAAAYTMDDLRTKKREILDTIREQVVPYFGERGISITTIGQFGGFTYENHDIQKAIDKVFEAQQDEEVAKAESAAAEQRKLALKLVGEGQAAQVLESKRGEAEGIKLVADAKAYEVEQLSKDPQSYLALKQFEIEEHRLKAWNGQYPQFLMGDKSLMGQTPLLLQMPAAVK